jgi:hypothetical protein
VDPSESVGTSWLESRLADTSAPTVALSPYFSLFAADFSREHPERRFVAFYGSGEPAENLVRVVYDREPAYRLAGELLAEWESVPGRQVAAVAVSETESDRVRLRALREEYLRATVADLEVEEYGADPEREEVSRVMRELLADGVNGFVVLLRSANRIALDILQNEPVVFATEHASYATSLSDALLFTIEDPVDEGLAAALEQLQGGVGAIVRVNAEVVRGAGYENPQLSAVPEPEE